MPVQLNGEDLITSFSDYEEGAWTPGIADTSNDGSGESQTYSVQVGRYQKVGNRVTIQGRLDVSSFGCLTTTQGARITGIPFVPSSLTNLRGGIVLGNAQNLNITAGSVVTFAVIEATGVFVINIWDATTGVTAMLLSELSSDCRLEFNGDYEI